MKNNIKEQKRCLKIINQIEKIRNKNNINWMDILRIAFVKDPETAKKCFQRISSHDKEINRLVEKLCR